MTRETKIGLLVGLAFIIVIGILLSDYNRLETQQAPLYGAMHNVQESTAAPGANDANHGEVAVVPPPSHQAAPRQPVPTREEVNGSRADRTSTVIVVHPGTGNPLPPEEHHRAADSDNATPDDGSNGTQVVVGPGKDANSETESNSSRDVPQDINTVANQNHEELVPLNPHNSPTGNNGGTTTTHNTTAQPEAGQHYTAVAGDTLSKLAGRFLGGNTKANREALIKANPTLQKNPNVIVVGRAYIIPAGTGGTAVASNSDKPRPTAPAAPSTTNEKPAPSTPTYWYTVKENDSLWKIAQDQLGDGNAWAAIKELNKDLLKGKEDVRPNMRLKLPAKPLASAAN